MTTINHIFQPLYEILYLLKNPKSPAPPHNPEYDSTKITAQLKEEALSFPDEKSIIAKTERLLNEIRQLQASTTDFSHLFSWPDLTVEQIRASLGKENLRVKTISTPPLEEWQRRIINEDVLEQLKVFEEALLFIKTTLVPEEKPVVEAFRYPHHDTHPNHLQKLLEWLIGIGLVNKQTNANDFRQIFSGGHPPADKVEWTGSKNALKYLIVCMAEEAIDPVDGRGKNISLDERINACFWSRNGLKDAGGAHAPGLKMRNRVKAIVNNFNGLSSSKNTRF